MRPALEGHAKRAATPPWIGVPCLLFAALASAIVANAWAGPRRHLNWFPQPIAAPVDPVPPSSPPIPAAARPLPPRPRAHRNSPRPREAHEALAELYLRYPPDPARPIRELGAEDAKWLHDRGALFLDARRSDAFEQGHIAGARSLPFWEADLAEKVAQALATCSDPSLPVVVYCSGGDCRDSYLLAEKLWLAGFRTLLTYTGGYPDWEARGWPVRQGSAP
jgi:rhodanese-related sulfurtransferase